MGNFSRDSFKETNILGNLLQLVTTPVTNPRQYVGVRMQQGVPILDADWNELEDLRRYDLQACLKNFFGDGIPDGDKGFEIAVVTQDNNFKIEIGLALVEGMLVINSQASLTYADQAALFSLSLPSLAPPGAGTRNDIVYLDVWEEERDGTASDDRLINPRIGIETCTRIERRWVVRVAPGLADLSGITRDPGHAYLGLALLSRVENTPRILASRITDLRRTQLNVSKYLQVPVFAKRGADLVDSDRMAQLFEALRSVLAARVMNNQLFVGPAVSDANRTIVYFAVQHIMQVCVAGGLQAAAKNLTNLGALEALSALHQAQNTFLDELSARGQAGSALTSFVSQYRELLTGGSGVPGIAPSLAVNDLIGVHKGQQAVNGFLAAVVDALPEGSVTRQFLSVIPFTPLVASQPFIFTVEFTSSVTSPDQTSEVFDVTASLTSALWNVTPTTTEITLNNVGGKGTLTFTVTPNSANATADFQVVVQARRNTNIQSHQLPLALQLGQRPAVAARLMYAGPLFNADGLMELPDADLRGGAGFDVNFGLNNRTDQQHSYRLRAQVTLQVGSLSGWTPTAAGPAQSDIVAAANTTGSAPINISKTGGSAVGNSGTLEVKLIRIDGPGDLPAQDQETVNVNFIVV
jgi:hypothetical protein